MILIMRYLLFASLFVTFSALISAQVIPSGTGKTCQPGSFQTGSACRKCPPNTFSDKVNAFECTRCPPRQTSGENRLSCRFCGVGKFFKERAPQPCRVCPIDTYSDVEDALECKKCPPGKLSPINSRNVSTCRSCPVGSVVFRGNANKFVSCRGCPSGQTTLKENALVCEKCRPVPAFRGDLPAGGNCRPCRPGTFSTRPGAVECKLCPLGRYENQFGSHKCTVCPKGSVVNMPGRDQCRAVCDESTPGCINCGVGEGYNPTRRRCEKCPAGSVSAIRSSTPCVPCPPGNEVKPNKLRTKCVCKPGFRSRKNRSCEPCRFGRANEDGSKCICPLMISSNSRFCSCPALSKREKDLCVPCNPNDDSDFPGCPSNTWNKKTNTCDSCPANTVSRSNSSKCTPCPDGTKRAQGEFSCTFEGGTGLKDGKCSACPPGTAAFGFGTQFGKCLSGTFSNEFGSRRCTKCPMGFRPKGKENVECLPPCPVGAERPDSVFRSFRVPVSATKDLRQAEKGIKCLALRAGSTKLSRTTSASASLVDSQDLT